jgi:hypothetical protein
VDVNIDVVGSATDGLSWFGGAVIGEVDSGRCTIGPEAKGVDAVLVAATGAVPSTSGCGRVSCAGGNASSC